ncbi:adenosylcobinamide-GDP ribazoletransferase [Phycicoccus endophyticus]|uniref:Adenosylcobinamide-GDP ribazoletransferase n=1 Tax=Phycicoccus endophyticus TaxID=1690220 RepID=A0A7G9R3L9_9MICO|nr:adenosylcobinamide-GDP ribazoletransferase [Phycicoccus endophyticus]NHI19957.1 adenosylcobinamide-GDP ribazoletransferase [Phycicoccus endophyticus]QNN50194.1 adenosylcobinamide-GDP ribazoletransferase [Phycicoccus endophyticus]
MRPSEAAAGLRLALGTLTVLPSGDVGEVTPGRAGWAMALAPVAALPVGAAVAASGLTGHLLGLPAPAAGALAVGAGALATRAMHLDGLADTVDGLGAGWDRERALAVMRAGDVGPMGAVALVLVLLAQASSLGVLTGSVAGSLLAGAAVALGRVACPAVCVRGLPPARPDGLGALVAATVPRAVAAGWVALAALALAALGWLAGVGLLAGPLGVLAGAAAVAWVVRRVVRAVAGVTGDTVGAAVETATTVLLLALAAGARP